MINLNIPFVRYKEMKECAYEFDTRYNPDKEIQADNFAGALLIPDYHFEEMFKKSLNHFSFPLQIQYFYYNLIIFSTINGGNK